MADSDRPLYKILSTRTIWWSAAVLVLVAVGTTIWLLLAFGYQLEAIKTASTIVLGTGGAAALLLAARRQRSTEIALNQKDRDLQHQERDAVERRITDLYTKAADQLGSDKAPVRLAGLYALERVAQNNPDQRQTIVNVLCAYLRMPYQLPGEPPADDADTQVVAADRERVQEREVRRTAQRLLADHLRPGDDPDNPLPAFWANTTIDLTGATLIGFTLGHCTVHTASFRSATFIGDAFFSSTTFTGDATFAGANFNGSASFSDVILAQIAEFDLASFVHYAIFSRAHFMEHAGFGGVSFGGDAFFENVTFDDLADFGQSNFNKRAEFGMTAFNEFVTFKDATFAQVVPDEVRDYWSRGDSWD